MTVLVTGGCGYIGAHTVWRLNELGYEIVVIDDLSTGTAALLPDSVKLYVGCITDRAFLECVFRAHRFDEILHFAAKIVPSESLVDPLSYFRVNVDGTASLVEQAVAHGVSHFVFSSTAAIYGSTGNHVVREDRRPEPITPYGESKLFAERILEAAGKAHGLRSTALRYFNVTGADAAGRCGPMGKSPGHLFRALVEVISGDQPVLQIFGSDYETPDGTCIRDYIHVSDLADAHIAVLDRSVSHNGFRALNCGYGQGFSVLEVVRAAQLLVGHAIPFQIDDRRPGDPDSVIADNSALLALGNWTPSHDNLAEMIESMLRWKDRLAARPMTSKSVSPSRPAN